MHFLLLCNNFLLMNQIIATGNFINGFRSRDNKLEIVFSGNILKLTNSCRIFISDLSSSIINI